MPGALDQLVAELRAWLGLDQPGIAWLPYGRERDRDEVLRRLEARYKLQPAIAFAPGKGEDPVAWLDRQLQTLPPDSVVSVHFPAELHGEREPLLNALALLKTDKPGPTQLWWCPQAIAAEASPDLMSWCQLRLFLPNEENQEALAQARQALRAATGNKDKSRLSLELANALRQAGHLEEAIPPAREAVALARELANTPDLVQALAILAECLQATGRANAAAEAASLLQQANEAQRDYLDSRAPGEKRAPSAVPKVFISSTMEDLKEVRAQVRDAAIANGFLPVMAEYFPARGRESLAECLAKVAEADVTLVLVAHRYGWTPPGETQSITWLEVEEARRQGQEVLTLLLDPKAEWPVQLTERGRLLENPSLAGEVVTNEQRLQDFKQDLGLFRGLFSTAQDARAKAGEALNAWAKAHRRELPAHAGDVEPYLAWVERDNARLRIRGLRTKRKEPYVFPIDELYIRLTTTAHFDRLPGESRTLSLEQTLDHPKLVVIGDPGAGKSTFVKRVVFEAARALRGGGARSSFLPADLTGKLPVALRAADLALEIRQGGAKHPPASPEWLFQTLAAQSAAHSWGLDGGYFKRRCQAGEVLLLIDGLDEAPDEATRRQMARLFENLTKAYPRCRFVVTTRPISYTGDTTLDEFRVVEIAGLEDAEIEVFFDHFVTALDLTEAQATEFRTDLRQALATQPDIRRMARNPVMLTALAVLQHNESKLPEARHELYESVIDWLVAFSRQDQPHRTSTKASMERLRYLALRMQSQPEGRIVQVNRHQAAQWLAEQFKTSRALELEFLEQEELDSNVVSSVGADLRYWHLSFQEYLAARELAGLDQEEMWRQVKGRLYDPEWRETLALLSGVLLGQGVPRLDFLVDRILSETKTSRDEIRALGLAGALERDLARLGYQPSSKRFGELKAKIQSAFDPQIPIAERVAAAEALGDADPRLRLPGDDDYWVPIPGGTFLMGNEKRREQVEPFEIGRYPVTVAEYRMFMMDRLGRARGLPNEWVEQGSIPNRPVTGVTWLDALAFCEWASAKYGRKIRLPTEREWERAARGTRGRTYPWGNEEPLPDRANFAETGLRRPSPVGLFPKGDTPEGIADLAGNVWEWCQDWYDRPENLRVLRGGSFLAAPDNLRAAARYGERPDSWYGLIGFRCVREPFG